MESNKRLFKYLSYTQLKALGIWWAIVATVNIISPIITFNLERDLVVGPMIKSGRILSFAGSSIFAALIFFVIYGIAIYQENFSLAGGFGVTRKSFYIQAMLSNVLIAAISGVIQVALLRLDNILIERIGYQPMLDFGYFNMNDNLVLNMAIVSFGFLVFISLGNLLGILVYRFSYRFWIGLGLIGFLTGLFAGSLGSMVMGLFEHGGFLTGLLVILLAYGAGFLAIRRIDVK